jgi:hypothetical protein
MVGEAGCAKTPDQQEFAEDIFALTPQTPPFPRGILKSRQRQKCFLRRESGGEFSHGLEGLPSMDLPGSPQAVDGRPAPTMTLRRRPVLANDALISPQALRRRWGYVGVSGGGPIPGHSQPRSFAPPTEDVVDPFAGLATWVAVSRAQSAATHTPRICNEMGVSVSAWRGRSPIPRRRRSESKPAAVP